ncbi:hypothetical protein P2318_32740 [Myxococcaceae bacterium GXIMD 01537]
MLRVNTARGSGVPTDTPSAADDYQWVDGDSQLFAEARTECVREQVGDNLYCPFPPRVHSHVDAVNVRTVAWARAMGLCKTDAQAEKLLAQKMGWLVARAFPESNVAALQVAADWLTLFCVMDDRIEKLRSPTRAGAFVTCVLDVFNHDAEPGPTADPFVRAMGDLRQRLQRLGSERVVARYAARLRELYDYIMVETTNRSIQAIPRLNTYFRMRQVTIGLQPFFVLWEVAEGVTLADEVREHPALRTLAARASNIVGWANDLFTYPKELLEAEVHNLVLVLMNERGLSEDEAAVMVGRLHDAQMRAFLVEEQEVPSFGPLVDGEVQRFTAMLRCWIRGHLDWAHETGRYKAPEGNAPEHAAATDLTV